MVPMTTTNRMFLIVAAYYEHLSCISSLKNPTFLTQKKIYL